MAAARCEEEVGGGG